jgi:hypothetical protein
VPDSRVTPDSQERPRWTFLTNHAHVLLCLAAEPNLPLREVAARVGITERATQKIVADLARDGYLQVTRVGRRNSYAVDPHGPFRHPLEKHKEVGALLRVFGVPTGGRRGR